MNDGRIEKDKGSDGDDKKARTALETKVVLLVISALFLGWVVVAISTAMRLF